MFFRLNLKIGFFATFFFCELTKESTFLAAIFCFYSLDAFQERKEVFLK